MGRAMSLLVALENVEVMVLPHVIENNPMNAAAPIVPKLAFTLNDGFVIDSLRNPT